MHLPLSRSYNLLFVFSRAALDKIPSSKPLDKPCDHDRPPSCLSAYHRCSIHRQSLRPSDHLPYLPNPSRLFSNLARQSTPTPPDRQMRRQELSMDPHIHHRPLTRRPGYWRVCPPVHNHPRRNGMVSAQTRNSLSGKCRETDLAVLMGNRCNCLCLPPPATHARLARLPSSNTKWHRAHQSNVVLR